MALLITFNDQHWEDTDDSNIYNLVGELGISNETNLTVSFESLKVSFKESNGNGYVGAYLFENVTLSPQSRHTITTAIPVPEELEYDGVDIVWDGIEVKKDGDVLTTNNEEFLNFLTLEFGDWNWRSDDDEEDSGSNVKRWVSALFLLIVAGWYVYTHYPFGNFIEEIGTQGTAVSVLKQFLTVPESFQLKSAEKAWEGKIPVVKFDGTTYNYGFVYRIRYTAKTPVGVTKNSCNFVAFKVNETEKSGQYLYKEKAGMATSLCDVPGEAGQVFGDEFFLNGLKQTSFNIEPANND